MPFEETPLIAALFRLLFGEGEYSEPVVRDSDCFSVVSAASTWDYNDYSEAESLVSVSPRTAANEAGADYAVDDNSWSNIEFTDEVEQTEQTGQAEQDSFLELTSVEESSWREEWERSSFLAAYSNVEPFEFPNHGIPEGYEDSD